MTMHPRRRLERALATEDGFTIVEGVVAGVVIVIGMLGVLTMLTGALRGTSANNARITATNLSRELLETLRGLDYDDMSGSLVKTRMQAKGFGSGSPWTIERRGVTFTLTATSCTFDDPADKLAATPPPEVCTPQPAGATGDANGEDFRRTTFELAWNDPSSGQRSLRQTTLVVNPTGGLGPRITGFTPVTQTITSSATTATIVWSTTSARSLQWMADDGQSSGSVTGTTSFTTNWDIGTSGSGSEVLDGSYTVTGQPFDDRDIAGEAKRANVVLNRRVPYAPPTLLGGHNTRFGDWVELQWSPNNERDIVGYRAFWAGLDGVAGSGDDLQVCPLISLGAILSPTTTSCAVISPPIGSSTYYVVAVDRNRENQLRDGDRRTLTLAPAGERPQAPTGPFTATTVGGQPSLSWRPPAVGSASFYRIYRDGFRYDRTSDATTTFVDGSPGGGFFGHSYRVTTVDATFNESDPIGPVFWWEP